MPACVPATEDLSSSAFSTAPRQFMTLSVSNELATRMLAEEIRD
jgi:hypothetical protein